MGGMTATLKKTTWPVGHRFKAGATPPALWQWAWEQVGEPPRPLFRRELAGFLRLIGYELPDDTDAQQLWDESAVCKLMERLEAERRWVPLHPLHVHKLTVTERRQHTDRAIATLQLVRDLQNSPIEELIGLMVDAEPREARATVASILRERLREDGTSEP